MTTIQSGFPINSLHGQQINTGKLEKLEEVKAFDESVLQPILTLEERQKQLDIQNSVHQSTVIEKNGEVIASFGENGFRHFSKNSYFNNSYINMTDTQVAAAMKEKYGQSIEVNTYTKGQGPTKGDMFERINGYSSPRLVDYTV